VSPPTSSASPQRALRNERIAQREQNWTQAWLVLFVVLWLLEGVLRKWLLPGLSDGIYFARDFATVTLFLLLLTTGSTRPSSRRLIWALGWGLGVGTLCMLQGIVTAQPLPSLAVGAITFTSPALAIALAFLIEDRGKVRRRVESILIAVLPVQALLTIVQTLSPEESQWNRVGDSSVGLTTTDGVVRATGTFTSPSGLTAFATVAAAVVLTRLIQRQTRPDLVVVSTALVSLAAVVTLGGSRGAILGVGGVLVAAVLFTLAGGVQQRMSAGGLGRVIVGLVALGAFVIAMTRLFPRVVNAFSARIELASEQEDSEARLSGAAFGYLDHISMLSWWGDGMGSHTLAGIAAGSPLGWVETELDRWTAELGLIGLLLVVARQVATPALLAFAWRASNQSGSPSAFLVGVALAPTLFLGAISAPSSQSGFFVTCVVLLRLAWSVRPEQPVSPRTLVLG
jgi:hypothetical protein